MTTREGKQYILHVEFQARDDEEMAYRMSEYRAILQRTYRLPVTQHVLYLGKGKSRMCSQLPPEEWIMGFDLINMEELAAEDLLISGEPTRIIFSILAGHEKVSEEELISSVLKELKKASGGEGALRRYSEQLLTLSRLHQVEGKVSEQLEQMTITYDIKEDALYKEGIQLGKREGVQLGRQEGVQLGRQEGIQLGKQLAIEALVGETELSDREIAQRLEVSEKLVAGIRSQQGRLG